MRTPIPFAPPAPANSPLPSFDELHRQKQVGLLLKEPKRTKNRVSPSAAIKSRSNRGVVVSTWSSTPVFWAMTCP